jgi:hypothetical protein
MRGGQGGKDEQEENARNAVELIKNMFDVGFSDVPS